MKENQSYQIFDVESDVIKSQIETNKMKVSICCLTYNHGRYLEEALQSFVSQQTTFDVEIVIGDDASSDGTPELVEKYCQDNTNIKYLRQEKNVGMMPNAVYALRNCTGEYIALCEGDDYWIDLLKLQKQVDFLEANREYAICATGSITRNEFNNKEEIQISPGSVTMEELIKNNRFCTATVVFAAEYLKPVPGWFTDLPFGDWATYLTVLHRSNKKAYSLGDITSVRRLHKGGIYTDMYRSDEKIIKTLKWDVEFYKKMQTFLFNEAYHLLIEACIKEKEGVISSLEGETGFLREMMKRVPENGSFILVDEMCLNITGDVEGKNILPFTEQDGVYWGRPIDDDAAIAEIERQQKKGANAIFFTWQAFWWLDHYSKMYEYLKKNYSCILDNGGLIGYDLQKRKSLQMLSASVN
jgi:glycosyltransferase involved in cell wall biosynthesis